MSEKPTGVFVLLPLSETDARKIRSAIDTPSYEPESLSAELLAIGTPVKGGDVQVAGWCHQVQLADLHKDNGSPDRERFVVMSLTQFVSRDVPLVRQSDAQAALVERYHAGWVAGKRDAHLSYTRKIAALEAEVGWLRTEFAKSKRKNFNAGYLIACCNIYNMHNEEGIAANILREAGITETEVKDLDLSEYDAEALAVIRSAGNDDPILKGGAA